MSALCAATLIEQLKLEAHVEGGFFRRTFTSENSHDLQAYCSSIYYLLSTRSPLGYLHKNQSDIVHYHHSGETLKYTLVSPAGELTETLLGCDVSRGEHPQLFVRGGYWKAAELLRSNPSHADYALISEAVIPEFRYEDIELATEAKIHQQHPHLASQLLALIKPKSSI